jgi:hypothetical protein
MLLRSLVDHAVQGGGLGLSRDAFILGAPRELSVALCRGNASLRRSVLHGGRLTGPCCADLLVPRLGLSEVVCGTVASAVSEHGPNYILG